MNEGQKNAQPKYKRCRFTPMDDRRLRECKSYSELLETIRAIVTETGYPRRSVVRRAKTLGVWQKWTLPRQQQRQQDRATLERLLARRNTKTDVISTIASNFGIERSVAQRRVYRITPSLNEGAYSLREVAQGLCMRKAAVRQLVEEGVLRATQVQESGKLYISSESIAVLAREHSRIIDWDRCMQRSPWLKDTLETVRVAELSKLLCNSKKTIRSWINNGFLRLPFNPRRVSDIFADEPVFRFLDEYPDLVDLAKCTRLSPDWFAKYQKVKGRYPRRTIRNDANFSPCDGVFQLSLKKR